MNLPRPLQFYGWLLALSFLLSCTPREPTPEQKELSSEVLCEPEEVKGQLKYMIANLGYLPRFNVFVTLRTFRSCLGAGRLSLLLEEAHQDLASGGRSPQADESSSRPQMGPALPPRKSKVRVPAIGGQGFEFLETDNPAHFFSQYEQVRRHKEFNHWVTGTATGVIGGALSLAGSPVLGIGVAAVGSITSNYLDKKYAMQAGYLASHYFDQDKFDPQELEAALNSSGDPQVVQRNYVEALRGQFNEEFRDIALDQDVIKGLTYAAERLQRGQAWLALQQRGTAAEIEQVRAQLSKTDQEMAAFQDATARKFEIIDQEMDQFKEILTHTGAVALENSRQIEFVQQVLSPHLTTKQKIKAIEVYNWGGLSPADKEKTLAALRSQDRIEDSYRDVTTVIQSVQGAISIFKNLGVNHPVLENAARISGQAMTLANAVMSFNAGPLGVLTGLQGISSLFAGSSKSAEMAMLEQISRKLDIVIDNQKIIIENQIRIMEGLVALSEQIDDRLNRIDKTLYNVELSLSRIKDLAEDSVKTRLNRCLDYNEFFKSRLADHYFRNHLADTLDGVSASSAIQSLKTSEGYFLFHDFEDFKRGLGDPSEGVLRLEAYKDCRDFLYGMASSVRWAQGQSSFVPSAILKLDFTGNHEKLEELSALRNLISVHFADPVTGDISPELVALSLNTSPTYKELKEKIAHYKEQSQEDSSLEKKITASDHWFLYRDQFTRGSLESQLLNPRLVTEMAEVLYEVSITKDLFNFTDSDINTFREFSQKRLDVEDLSSLESMAAIITVAILQQNLLYGDVLLEKIEPHFDPQSPPDQRRDAVAFFGDLTQSNIKRDVFDLATSSALIAENLIRYRIYKRLEPSTSMIYDLAYNNPTLDKQGKGCPSPPTEGCAPSDEFMRQLLGPLGLKPLWKNGAWVVEVASLSQADRDKIYSNVSAATPKKEDEQAAAKDYQKIAAPLMDITLPHPVVAQYGLFQTSPYIAKLYEWRASLHHEISFYKAFQELERSGQKQDAWYDAYLVLSGYIL